LSVAGFVVLLVIAIAGRKPEEKRLVKPDQRETV
jgi:hypothetical protein